MVVGLFRPGATIFENGNEEGVTALRIGIDTGGTFTDVVVADDDGVLATTKTPSTPEDPAVAFMAGVAKGGDAAGAPGAPPAAVSHGTTVATNALLQEDFSALALVVTEGFRHILEIARQSVPEGYGNSYFWVKPERIVPLHLVYEVPERMDAQGNVVRAFDEAAARSLARRLKDDGVRAAGICFVNAYVDPAHERKMRAVIAEEHPECAVSISSDVLREYREYERSVTVLIDAFVKPLIAHYVRGIRARLDERAGNHVPFYVMKSNGGVMSAEEVAAQPITTVLSGPAAGVLGATAVASAAGFDRVMTLDGGGTSTDVSVVRDGRPALTTEGSVGRHPVKVPMVDIVTVGTGGGSIAYVSPEGGLKVGPRSAGADPGPLCYRRGGTEPTATDAHLLLGRIPPALLGGEVPLDEDAARRGYESLAARLGMSLDACAAGVLEIAAWNQANAIRGVTVRRGLDVRDFVMVAFGGSGPLTACALIDILGLDAALVPLDPGNLSAFGLLSVDVRGDYVQTFVRTGDEVTTAQLGSVYAELQDQAAAALRRAGFADDRHVFARAADLRYKGQAFEVRVDAPSGDVDDSFVAAVTERFHDEHERLYGYCYRDGSQSVEWVNVRIAGIGPIARPALRRAGPGGDIDTARLGVRRAYFAGEWDDIPRYDRTRLGAGDVIAGPAIVEEFGSTLPLAPAFSGTVDDFGNIIVSR